MVRHSPLSDWQKGNLWCVSSAHHLCFSLGPTTVWYINCSTDKHIHCKRALVMIVKLWKSGAVVTGATEKLLTWLPYAVICSCMISRHVDKSYTDQGRKYYSKYAYSTIWHRAYWQTDRHFYLCLIFGQISIEWSIHEYLITNVLTQHEQWIIKAPV